MKLSFRRKRLMGLLMFILLGIGALYVWRVLDRPVVTVLNRSGHNIEDIQFLLGDKEELLGSLNVGEIAKYPLHVKTARGLEIRFQFKNGQIVKKPVGYIEARGGYRFQIEIFPDGKIKRKAAMNAGLFGNWADLDGNPI